MPGSTDDLQGVLDGYSRFLREKDLEPAAHQPYLVRRVREFLHFAQTHRGYSLSRPSICSLPTWGTKIAPRYCR